MIEQFIKNNRVKQFSVEDMLEFAAYIVAKKNPDFDGSSVEMWFNKKHERIQMLLNDWDKHNSKTGKSW